MKLDKVNLRNNNFDFLRFLAATMVIFSHSYALSGNKNEPYLLISNYATFGSLAVNIFFVLSGFLIIKSWLDNPNVFDYLKKRILRIMPGLFVAVVFTVLVIGPMATSLNYYEYFTHPLTREYLNNATLSINFFLPGVFANNPYKDAVNGSLWTLPVEFKLYVMILILGLVGLFYRRLTAALLGGGILVYGIIDIISPDIFDLNSTEKDYLRCLIYFVIGALFYLYRDRVKFSKELFLFSIMGLIISYFLRYGAVLSYAFLPYIILYFGFNKINKLDIFSKFGDFSYGLYIYAFPVQQLVIYFSKNKLPLLLFFLISFFVTFILAINSWYLVEKPFLKLKKISFTNLFLMLFDKIRIDKFFYNKEKNKYE
jgi:peptidoglycan/LPS O-acetylase OafA/YrhL